MGFSPLYMYEGVGVGWRKEGRERRMGEDKGRKGGRTKEGGKEGGNEGGALEGREVYWLVLGQLDTN